MNLQKTIFTVIMLALSLSSFVISVLQFMEKGPVFDNAYIYASKAARAAMYKKPYYRRSAIVFIAGGIIFLLIALAIITGAQLFFNITGVLALALIVYTLISQKFIN